MEMWTKRNYDHAPKCECVDFLNIGSKRAVLEGKKFQVQPFSCLLLFASPLPSPLSRKSFILYYINISLPWAFFLSLPEYFFCLSHRKTRWTTSVDTIGLKTRIFGTSNSMVTLTFPPWCKRKWSTPEQVQQPITNFTRPRDNFMVHGVNYPSIVSHLKLTP